jgi:predicted GNAT family acetyltransferase
VFPYLTNSMNMAPELEELPLTNNESLRQFELIVDGGKAKIEYERQKDRMFLTHTEVPAALEGHGVGAAIVEKTLHYLEENNLKLVPWCPFVKTYIKRHPEWKRVLAQGIQI